MRIAEPPPHRGACYGFDLRSTAPLSFLRSGGGQPLEIHEGHVDPPAGEPVAKWPELTGRRAYAAVHADGDHRYRVTVGRMGRFEVDTHAGRIRMDLDPELPPASRAGLLFATPMALCVTARGDLAIHAGSVDIGGVALLLVTSGAGGKTTLTASFHRAGFRALSDDLTACRSLPASVYPGPALLRLREDSTAVLLLTGGEVTAVRAGKTHFAVDPERGGTGAPVPLAGIVFLEWAFGQPRLDSVTSQVALARLWRLSFFLPGDDDRRRCFEGIAALTDRLPAWVLRRDRDFRQLDSLVAMLVERCVTTA